MKITMSHHPSQLPVPAQGMVRTVSVDTGNDDLNISEVMKEIRGLFIAYGFHPNSVDEYIHLD
tara:strand:+ start:368 stop:556 length:189 start_codon:yes stop_codon:yes gene_type:complete